MIFNKTSVLMSNEVLNRKHDKNIEIRKHAHLLEFPIFMRIILRY